MMRKISLLALLVFACWLPAQEAGQDETDGSIPELAQFHEVIYPLWHTAFPAKDYQMLRDLIPDIQAHVERLEKAALPGILRDKAGKWQEGIAELRRIAGEYALAAAENRNEALLAAAEALHAQFEKLVRIIRPALPEVEEFHKVLYTVYHRHLPARDIASIRAVAADLETKAAALARAALPPRRSDKQEAFAAAGAKLQAECRALAVALQGGDETTVLGAVETLHRAYRELENIFD